MIACNDFIFVAATFRWPSLFFRQLCSRFFPQLCFRAASGAVA